MQGRRAGDDRHLAGETGRRHERDGLAVGAAPRKPAAQDICRLRQRGAPTTAHERPGQVLGEEGGAAVMAVLRAVGAGGAYWPAGVTTIVPYIPSGSWMMHSYLKMPAVGKVSW